VTTDFSLAREALTPALAVKGAKDDIADIASRFG
jgi:hypothetical protein